MDDSQEVLSIHNRVVSSADDQNAQPARAEKGKERMREEDEEDAEEPSTEVWRFRFMFYLN